MQFVPQKCEAAKSVETCPTGCFWSTTNKACEDGQSVPSEPGCFILTPSGCPKQNWIARLWTRDSWGEKNKGAHLFHGSCEQRKKDFNAWCGVTDVKIKFNKKVCTKFTAEESCPAHGCYWSGKKCEAGQKAPQNPGCYVHTPSGCPKQSYSAYLWTRDEWGEKNRKAGIEEKACTEVRKKDFINWCGAKDIEMRYNSQTKFSFKLRGNEGVEQVEIDVNGKKQRTTLTKEWKVFDYHEVPSGGVFFVNFLNDRYVPAQGIDNNVYLQAIEPKSQVAKHPRNWGAWKCGTGNENERCNAVRSGTFAWAGRYPITVTGGE